MPLTFVYLQLCTAWLGRADVGFAEVLCPDVGDVRVVLRQHVLEVLLHIAARMDALALDVRAE